VSLSEFSPKYLRLEPRADVVVVRVSLPLLTEEINLEQVGHELFALVEQCGCRKLVVSLLDVQMITSAGLGKLITLHRKMHRHQGSVIFCDIQPAVEDVLRTSRLITYLHVSPDIEAGVALLPQG
jgi:anti-sigma B factor antagonist